MFDVHVDVLWENHSWNNTNQSTISLEKVKTLFYNDYETSSTTYINHARWHRCLRSDGLRLRGNRSSRRKPTCPTW